MLKGFFFKILFIQLLVYLIKFFSFPLYDNDVLFKARESAKDILAIDPNLELEEHVHKKYLTI